MSTLRTKIGTGVTLAALGGLSAYAVASQPADSTQGAQAAAPVEVRTVVERHTVHVTRHAKPKRVHHRTGRAPSAAAPPPAPAPAPSAPVAAAVSPAPARVPQVAAAPAPASHAPVTTRTSGSSGSGRSGEHEVEDRGDDHGEGHEGNDD